MQKRLIKRHTLNETKALREYSKLEKSNYLEVLKKAYLKGLALYKKGFMATPNYVYWHKGRFYSEEDFIDCPPNTLSINGDLIPERFYDLGAVEPSLPDYALDELAHLSYKSWSPKVNSRYTKVSAESPEITPYKFILCYSALREDMYKEYLDKNIDDIIKINYIDEFKKFFRKYLENYYCLEEGFLNRED